MIVLTTETTAQTFNFIPRLEDFDVDVFPIQDEQTNVIFNFPVNTSYTDYNKLELTDEQSGTSTVYDIVTFTTSDYFHTISLSFSGLIEGHTYMMRIYRDSKTNTRFLGKVLVTDNSLPYSVNDSAYNKRETTNDFIIYE
jgi:hypothetical protein